MDGKGLCEIKVDRLRLKTVALRRLMTEGRLEVESKSQECLVIIKREVTSNILPKRRVPSSTHGVVGGRRLATASYPIVAKIHISDKILIFQKYLFEMWYSDIIKSTKFGIISSYAT